MTVNRKQESNPSAVLITLLKLYNDLVGDRWLRDAHLTAQSSSHWTSRFSLPPQLWFPILISNSCIPQTTLKCPSSSLHHSPELSSSTTPAELPPTVMIR